MEGQREFARVLKRALDEGHVQLSKRVKYEYEPLWAIRAVERDDTDDSAVGESDFYSQEEKRYYGFKLPRGVKFSFSSDLGQYSCSFFKTKADMANAMHLPKKGWKLAVGNLLNCYGGILHKEKKPHIHLFRFDQVVPAFDIIEFEDRQGEDDGKDGMLCN